MAQKKKAVLPPAKLDKRRYIKDPLWQSILLFPWEKRLIEHPVFNRLNDILQNSSGFRVYPGLKVTRFLHSIGVMHVATKIYQNIASTCLTQIERSEKINKFLLEAANIKEIERFTEQETSRVASYVRRDTPLAFSGSKTQEENLSIYLTVVRIAALVHDIGHLPYSHVAEHALEALYDSSENTFPKKSQALEIQFRKTMQRLLEVAEEEEDEKSQRTKPHEVLGKELLPFIQGIFRNTYNNHSCNDDAELLIKLIGAASRILHKKEFPIGQSILKGTIDADRIDFVRRDTHFSGLLTSSVDYERLFSLFELTELKKDGKPYIVAAPNERALSEVKKLLWERFQDYKFIICHHRVHFFDELVQRCIIELARIGYLNKYIERIGRLNTNLGGAIPDLFRHINQQLDLITSLDDHWLEMQFRRAFAECMTGMDTDTGKPSRFQFDEWTRSLLTAYVSERSLFKSAFRRDEEFWQYCGHNGFSFLTEIQQNPDATERRILLAEIADDVNELKHKWEIELRKKHGYPVIIGDVSNKLSIGISGPYAAATLGLKGFSKFLESEVINTMPFNFWFIAEEHRYDSIKQEIFDFIVKRIDPQTRLKFNYTNPE